MEALANFRGHCGFPTHLVKSTTLSRFWKYNVESAADSFARQRERKPELWKDFCFSEFMNSCDICGEPVSMMETKPGSNKMKAKTKCPAPGGFPPFDVTVDCPSGKMIFANDLRKLVAVEDDFNVNSTKGIIQTVKAYEETGLLYIIVGNSSPEVFRKGASNLCISRMYDENRDTRFVPGHKGYKSVASVCTDLWWVCGMDYEKFKALCKEKKIEESRFFPTWLPGKPITVTPGKWAFTFDPMPKCEFTTCFGKHVG